MELLDMAWCKAKRLRKIKLGLINIEFQMRRSIYVSNNFLRHMRRFFNSAKPDTPFANTSHTKALDMSLESSEPQGVKTALIVGVGPGLGFALARKLHSEGFQVALASRNAGRFDGLVDEMNASGNLVRAYGCDATDEKSVIQLMSLVSAEFGVPHLVVYSVQEFCPGQVMDVEIPAFELSWRQNCLGGFIVAREASRRMAALGRGAIVLVGSTSSLIGRADHLNLAIGKFGLRALSQVMARELWPKGIHVAHIVIDADIQEDEQVEEPYPQSSPEHISQQIYISTLAIFISAESGRLPS